MLTTTNVTTQQLRRALEVKGEIETLQRELDAIFGESTGGNGNGERRGRPKGSKMSAAARARISEAQKARWAKYHAKNK